MNNCRAVFYVKAFTKDCSWLFFLWGGNRSSSVIFFSANSNPEEYPFIVITPHSPGQLLTGVVKPAIIPSLDQKDQFKMH